MSVGEAVFAAALRGNYPTEVADIREVRDAWKKANGDYLIAVHQGHLVHTNANRKTTNNAAWEVRTLRSNYMSRLQTLITKAVTERDLDFHKVHRYSFNRIGELL